MRQAPAIAVSAIAACAAAAGVLSPVSASDHLDGPRAVADPQADIADVFAFTSPESSGYVVLAMTVLPYASASAEFSTGVDYVFRVRRVVAPQPLTFDTTSLDITCDFDGGDGATQTVTCAGPAGMQATAPIGVTTGADPQSAMRVFAGRRADPAFFDRQGALATVESGRTSFTGQNAFAGADVLAIVVELNAAAISGAGAPLPMLAVAAETVRRAPP
ncbi:MAG TPA: DUF4331 family protein [Polyangiaceae bacterium]|nr:DUF4331 family protein [Polyangiaceae bacterium]